MAEPQASASPRRERQPLHSHGAVGDALISEVSSALPTLRALLSHAGSFGAGPAQTVRATLAEVERRLGATELTVVVVGEPHAGKRTLLDAIIGEARVGAARRELFAITFLRNGALPSYRARFSAGTTEDHARRVPDLTPQLDARLADLEGALATARDSAEHARAELAAALDGQEDERAAHQRALGAQRSLMSIQERGALERAALERRAEAAERELEAAEAALPARLRRWGAQGGFWALFVSLLLALFWSGLWRRYRVLKAERHQARLRLDAGELAARHASETRADADDELARLGAHLTERASRAAAGQATLARSEAETARLGAEIDDLKRERDRRSAERRERFFLDLTTLSRRGTVTELEIDYPARYLPPDITLVDVRGLMELGAGERPEIWRVIQEEADGCIFVSELDRAVSEAAKRFLQRLREAVPHVLLVLTKVDKAFEDATARGGMDPWEQVEQARRIGTRRFARELGRDPSSVLSISVAAQAALDAGAGGSRLAARFEAEVQKLFELLRRERAIMLGARAAGAIRSCIAGLGEAEELAREAGRAKLAALEAQRIPEPAAFRRAQLALAAPRIDAVVRELDDRVRVTIRDGFQLTRRLVEQRLAAFTNGAELARAIPLLERELEQRAAAVCEEARLELEARSSRALTELERDLLEELGQKYQLLHDLRAEAQATSSVAIPAPEPLATVSLDPGVKATIARHRRARIALGGGGAVAGAALGTAVLPGVGTLVGAGLGMLLAFGPTPRALKRRSLAAIEPVLATQEGELLAEMEAARPAIAAQVRQSLDRSLERASVRFERWIQEPIEAERRAITSARESLADLEQIGAQLEQHDHSLAALLASAADESLGLCR